MELLLLAALTGGLFLGVIWLGRRPDVVVVLAEGRATVLKGDPARALVHDLEEIARFTPRARGRIEIRGSGDRLDLRTPGLDDGVGQRVRNVVLMRKHRI